MGAGVIPRFWAAPPGLYSQRETDPTAGLISGALGGLQTARNFALQNRAQRDADTDRQQRVGLALLQAGFAPGEGQPTGAVQAPGVGSIPDFANTPETYQIPGVGAVHRIPTDKDILSRNTTDTQRSTRVAIGHQLATSVLGHDVDDGTAEGIGASPAAWMTANKEPAPKNIDPLSPQGIAATLKLKRGEADLPNKGGPGGLQGQEAFGVLQTLGSANSSLEGLEKTNAPQIPLTAAIAGGITGKLAGAETGEGVRTSMLSPAQQNYQSAATLWLHNYAALLPKARVQPTTLAQLRLAFFPPAGADPSTYGSYAQRRRDATAALTNALHGQRTDLTSVPGFEGLSVQGGGFVEGGGNPAPTPSPAPIAPHAPGAMTPTPTPRTPINWRKWQ